MFSVNGYQIMESIGEGGSSEVFKALRASDNLNVALKVLHPRYSDNLEMRKRLSREARVIMSLKHRNIVRIFQFGDVEQRFYIILEYLPNGSLSNYKRLSMRRRLKVMIQICDSVDYIHRHGIVHRDLKPSNIMFGADDLPRLVDFGISLFGNEDFTRLTHTNMVMGTLSYMSPEQQSDPSSVDHRTDIYSLGAVLYEVFTGKRPVGRFEKPTMIVENFDTRLEDCIMKALEHRMDMRYNKARELGEALMVLWHDGLFEDAEDDIHESFDGRIGYWVKKLENGGVTDKLEAREQILSNVQPGDAQQLIEICKSSEVDVRGAVIPALGRLRDKAAVPFLISQVGNPLITREACVALADIGDPRALAPIIKVVKGRAVFAHHALVPLARLGGEKDLKLLLPYLKTDSFSDRAAAVKAFESAPTRKYLRDLKKAHKVESDRDLKSRLYTLIQQLEVRG